MHSRDGSRDGKLQLMEGLEGLRHSLQERWQTVVKVIDMKLYLNILANLFHLETAGLRLQQSHLNRRLV